MTRRYNLSHPVGQPMPEDWLDLPDSVVAAADYDAISARLAATERLLLVARDCLRTAHNGWAETLGREIDAFFVPAISAVQPERCCVDYPRCDCNSPPELEDAPALQPCGHPWKAQHDFKCILCSSPGTAL